MKPCCLATLVLLTCSSLSFAQDPPPDGVQALIDELDDRGYTIFAQILADSNEYRNWLDVHILTERDVGVIVVPDEILSDLGIAATGFATDAERTDFLKWHFLQEAVSPTNALDNMTVVLLFEPTLTGGAPGTTPATPVTIPVGAGTDFDVEQSFIKDWMEPAVAFGEDGLLSIFVVDGPINLGSTAAGPINPGTSIPVYTAVGNPPCSRVRIRNNHPLKALVIEITDQDNVVTTQPLPAGGTVDVVGTIKQIQIGNTNLQRLPLPTVTVTPC